MIRLFTALEIPDPVSLRLQMLQSGLRGARWISPENFHITLRFIGDVPEDVANEIDDALAKINDAPFDIELEGIGQFGHAKPHAVWAAVKPTPALTALQARQEMILQRAGLAPETRKYTPHVTLARLTRSATSPGEVMQYIEHNNLFSAQPFEAARFVLFSSRASRGGGPYVAERTYDLNSVFHEACE
ncbi:MAG: RNA 2',3'-cyclic phosphodiesterase [Parvibaculum sp.]